MTWAPRRRPDSPVPVDHSAAPQERSAPANRCCGDPLAADAAATIADLRARADALQQELRRALADADNMRKRFDREITRIRDQERAAVAQRWLPVVDNLDRALEYAAPIRPGSSRACARSGTRRCGCWPSLGSPVATTPARNSIPRATTRSDRGRAARRRPGPWCRWCSPRTDPGSTSYGLRWSWWRMVPDGRPGLLPGAGCPAGREPGGDPAGIPEACPHLPP